MSPELKTPPARRLVSTGTPGIFRRGNRYVAISYRHGRRIKTTHDTKPTPAKPAHDAPAATRSQAANASRTTPNAG